MLTIFTPTYNRANNLVVLYDSLCHQTSQDFIWLIVDDGSTDNTCELVSAWQNENKINITYCKQANGGKHRAINRGVAMCDTSLFFIVDSDDYLTNDAVEWIIGEANDVLLNPTLAGFSGVRIAPNGIRIGGGKDFVSIDTSYLNLRLVEKITGDMAEIYKTAVLKEYPFLEIEGEKFCPEALVWNRISQKYRMRFIHKSIYVCEYLPGGLTDTIIKIRRKSPLTSMIYYSELVHFDIPFVQKVKGCINFWRFAPIKYYNKSIQLGMINIMSILSLPIGLLFRLKDIAIYR